MVGDHLGAGEVLPVIIQRHLYVVIRTLLPVCRSRCSRCQPCFTGCWQSRAQLAERVFSVVELVTFHRDQNRLAAVQELAGLGPLPDQCGVVVAHGPRVVAAEIFGAPHLLTPHWPALIRSHLLEHATDTGRTSATGALRLLGRFGTAESTDSPGIGLGIERHVRGQRVTGQALTLESAIVHASAFRPA